MPSPPLSPTCLPRSNLKRYLHYLTRYEANLQACKLEEKLRKARGAGCWWMLRGACILYSQVGLVGPPGWYLCPKRLTSSAMSLGFLLANLLHACMATR